LVDPAQTGNWRKSERRYSLFDQSNVFLHDARVVLLVHANILQFTMSGRLELPANLLELPVQLVDPGFQIRSLLLVLKMDVFCSSLGSGQLARDMAANGA